MFLEKVHSEGLSHVSYILGDGGQAAAIDPRRDCEVYIDIAHREGARITHIFETHRNEDYVIGSGDLSRRTGAEIFHGQALDFKYGTPVSEGDRFELGQTRLRILETPGHTYESISIVLEDTSFGDDPVTVFTGDALFVGDVGRTDFFPDKAREVAGLLYDSIFEKLLPLGDSVVLFPAHGAGSVCGNSMADREVSTLGYERRNNPVLQLTDREEFIQYKIEETHYQPHYFRKMEEYNQNGAPPMERVPSPAPVSADEFAEKQGEGMQVVDVRSPEAFAGAFVPGSYSIPLKMIPAYSGYFLSYKQPIGLVVDEFSQVDVAVCHLIRMGYSDICCFLEKGIYSWETKGRKFGRVGRLSADELIQRIERDEPFTLLDVRKESEYKESRLDMATCIFLGHLPEKLDSIPKDRPVVTFCGSGRRAMIGASLLKMHGFEQVEDVLGSMSACKAVGCPLVGDNT